MAFILTGWGALPAHAQGRRGPPSPPTLGLDQGFLEFDTPDFHLKLVKASQTVAALEAKSPEAFDFTPGNQLEFRSRDRYNYLGDLTFRTRAGDSGPWQSFSTSAVRQPVTALEAKAPVLAAADLAPTLPDDCPLQVTRTWSLENGQLVLRFVLKNKTSAPLQIGALGMPMIFNNILTDLATNRPFPQMYQICDFFDPAINEDGGYLQVTRLNGHGPALVVVPEGKTPFEAWRPLSEPTPPGQTFEGAFEWMVHSQAYAENEWKNAKPWNPPTMAALAPGETKTIGVKFLLSPQIRDIEQTLAAAGRPVAVGIPGYILPMDINGKLFLNYPHQIAAIDSDPAGAITAVQNAPTPHGWQDLTLHGQTWGRARLVIRYDDGTQQAISYYIIKPAAQAVADLGNFLFTKQWYVNPNDPFGRSPSVMTYDRAHDRIVTQDFRAWVAGLGDEGGAGSWLAAAMKESGQPNAGEVGKYQQFVDQVLWGGLQYRDGPRQYGVKKSMFYHDPAALPDFQYDPNINWSGWTAWNKQAADAVNRAYDYPHVVAAYWAMYRLARNYQNLVTAHRWDWYLNQAFLTAYYLGTHNNIGNSRDGLMDGTIFLLLLDDLKHEHWPDQYQLLYGILQNRANDWNARPLPFGSEMAWDCTGQEEVYGVTKLFGFDEKAQITLDSILGYMPGIPNWGYNGNARRYWDFYYGGAPGGGTERQLHHYGSGLNAIPVLAAYRDHPGDFYLLRVGYGGAMGGLSNIDQEGFAGTAFHSYPQNMRWDTYSGDYGPNFFGVATNAATYVIDHPEFGWQAFGGNVQVDGDWVKVQPLDCFRQRVYLAPLGLWLTLDAGAFDHVELNAKTHAVRLALAPASAIAPTAYLRIAQPAKINGIGTYQPTEKFKLDHEAFAVPLGKDLVEVSLADATK
ncbi:MAG TPA: DUF5695 domain-containing protein [Opitutales bacterium]|nr:DUF5695 domain-containing protein [Opitutales bacterium]